MYPKTPLKNLITITTWKLDANAMVIWWKYPFFTCAREFYQIDDFAFDWESILVAGNGDLNVKYYNWKFNAYQRTYVLQNFKWVDGKYLYYVIEDNLALLRSGSRGSTIKYIRLWDLQNMQIPLPPLPTQHLIVSEIEKQFSRLDEWLLSLRRAKENLKKYKASVLKSAVEWKLTEDFRKTQKLEPANILLEKILEERKKKFLSEKPGGKYKQPEAIKQDDLPNIELPEGWEWCRLSDIFDVWTWSTPSKSNKEYWENWSIPWVSSSCVNLNFVDKADLYVTEKALQETNVKIFPIWTILIALYWEWKTRWNITELRIESTTNQALAWIIFDNINLSFKEYLKIFFLYNYDNIRKQSAGWVQPNLNVWKIKEIIFPLPPLSEQNEIVKIVESKLSVVEKLEKLVDENIKRSENLKQSILKKAFEGELVRGE